MILSFFVLLANGLKSQDLLWADQIEVVKKMKMINTFPSPNSVPWDNT
jgi:hypothetical protein